MAKPGQLHGSAGVEWACSVQFLNPLSKSHCGACGAVNPSHKNKWAIGINRTEKFQQDHQAK